MSKCVSPATSSPNDELSRAHGLYVSYTHWRCDATLDVKDYQYILDSTGWPHENLEFDWDCGCYPDGDEIISPNIVSDD